MGWEDERKRRNEGELIPDVGGCEREMGISDNAEARRTVQDRMTIVCAVARLENQSIGTRVEAVNRGLKDSLRPNDWSNWASFWQGVQIWYPCENVLGEIAFRLVELQ